MGADTVESDVQDSRDEQIVLFHGDLVNRPSDAQGPLADHTLADLRKLDVER